MGSRATESLSPIEATGTQLIHYRMNCSAVCQNVRALRTREENLTSICEVGSSTYPENHSPDRDVVRTPSVTRTKTTLSPAATQGQATKQQQHQRIRLGNQSERTVRTRDRHRLAAGGPDLQCFSATTDNV